MKAITLWEPWALLWALQIKKYETRGWATNYRGPIAIHAASRKISVIYKELFPCADYEFHPSYFAKKQFCDAIKSCGLNENELPTGCIVATAELVDCHQIVRYGGRGMSSEGPGWIETEEGIYLPTEQELMFGDWTPGRYAWEVRNMKMLPEPIPAKGKQRLWNWEEINENI